MSSMNVYNDLVRIGMREENARELAESMDRHKNLVTTAELGDLRRHMDARFAAIDVRFAELDGRFSKLEASLTHTVLLAMIAMTGISAGFTAALAWVIK